MENIIRKKADLTSAFLPTQINGETNVLYPQRIVS